MKEAQALAETGMAGTVRRVEAGSGSDALSGLY